MSIAGTCARQRPRALHAAKYRQFVELQADVNRYGQKHERQQERDTPAPLREIGASISLRQASTTASESKSPSVEVV